MSAPAALIALVILGVALLVIRKVCDLHDEMADEREQARADYEASRRALSLVRGPAPPPFTIEQRNAQARAEWEQKRLSAKWMSDAARVGE